MHNSLFTIALLLTAATTAAAQSPATGQILGHDYVDLGLSVMWATCNIGALQPSDLGSYYFWGSDRVNGSNVYASTEHPATEETFIDAATVNWGSQWRMPTENEMQELIINCKWKWKKVNNVPGYLITSNINGNSIFLPATAPGTTRWSAYLSSSTSVSSHGYNGVSGFEFWEKDYMVSWLTTKDKHTIRPITNLQPTEENITKSPATCQVLDHDCVNLGLSVKWATCNVGADKPEDCGDYFAWGEMETKSNYNINNSATYKKSSCDFFDPSGKWGSAWRMPTNDECKELINNCTFQWETLGNNNGYRVTSKINGNSIFLPVTGKYRGSSLIETNSGFYQCFDPGEDKFSIVPTVNSCLWIHGKVYQMGGVGREEGIPIRPVTEW